MCTEDGMLGFQGSSRVDTFLEQLVNHNGDPLPGFSKVLISKRFKFFRKNTCRSVDSAWFFGALNLDKSNTRGPEARAVDGRTAEGAGMVPRSVLVNT